MANNITAAGSVTTSTPLNTWEHTHTRFLKPLLVSGATFEPRTPFRSVLSNRCRFSSLTLAVIQPDSGHLEACHIQTIEGLKLLQSVHLPDKFSFPFPAASMENIYHMLRQVLFYSNTLPQGKQNTGWAAILKSWKIQQSKRPDTFVHLFLSSSVTSTLL